VKRSSEIKLIDLLSLRPGSLLSVHAIKGQVECRPADAPTRGANWREEISNACFPNGDPLKIHNFSKLLEISVDAQVIVRFPDRKVLEILRLESNSWHTLLSHVGYHAAVMVNGRVIAEGEIVNGAGQNGILINKVVGL
jgi:flagellar motor switch/type III secretory pathway protein FliN